MSAPATPQLQRVPVIQGGDWHRVVAVGVNHLLKHTEPLLRDDSGLHNADNFDLRSGFSYHINGVQVVGAQQPAIADAMNAAGDPPTEAEFNAVVAVINTLLSELRTHGLIAS